MRSKIDLSIFSTSKFRKKFSLKENVIRKSKELGRDKLESDAIEIILKRIAPAMIPNDGKQTPFKGHPVFIAQHATATCCRSCLEKWHYIEKEKELSSTELEYVVSFIIAWIEFKTKDFELVENQMRLF